jgi:glucosamine--fructose-6-phosphate aminotransferase (isomerizing)
MEGALKLKELSYIHAEGFASGEIEAWARLRDRRRPARLLPLLAADAVMAKASSNLREASARGGKIILLSEARAAAEVDYASAVITVPDVDPLPCAHPACHSSTDFGLSNRG